MKAEQLRKSILQYAIQGKLVPQVDTEEPASELLKKIKAEKQELVKQGKIKKEKQLPTIADDEKPFDIPDSWEYVHFLDIANLFTGNSINSQEKKNKYTNLTVGYNYIATKDVSFDSTIDYNNGIKIPFETNFKIATQNSSLLCIEGGSAGRKVAILNQDVCFGNKLCCFEPHLLDNNYLFYYLQSPIFTENFTGNMSGMIGGVGVNTLKTLLFLLPPLAEQQRIVARIEELMFLVDEYNKKEIELSKLEKKFPDKLQKSILQYASQGKLVPQIDTEELASELLKKIYHEKKEIIKQGKIKKEKPLPPTTDEKKPFDIPQSWKWARLGEILYSLPRNGFSPRGVEKITDLKVLTLSATTQGILDLSKFKYINDDIEKDSYLRLHKNDILIQRSNSLDYVGVSCLFDCEDTKYIYPDLMIKIRVIEFVSSEYILNVLLSPFVRQYFRNEAGGTSDTMKKITQNIVSNTLIPLPPLAEQQRIVARIKELFALVDALVESKKLPKVTVITENKDNVIPFVTVENDETKHRVEVSSFEMAARDSDSVKPETMEKVLEQVQAYYDKKN